MVENLQNMTRNYSEINHRLTSLMKAKGITILALSKQANIAIGTIQKLMTDPSCNPTISSLEAICNALGVSIIELIGQDKKMSSSLGNDVVLLAWDELPLALSDIQTIVINDGKKRDFIKTSCQVSKNTFALKMQDNSMLPLFPENTILIFDPDKAEKDGNYILAHIHTYPNIMFKQLLIDEPFRYVKSISPQFKDNIIKLEKKDKIIATLIQSQIQH